MAINFKRLENLAKALKPLNQSGQSFHATFVYHGNKLICIANNDYSRLHPYHKFGQYIATKNGNYIAGLHGETAALIKMGLEDCSHLTFVNVRIDNKGNAAISKPCLNCQRLLTQTGYKSIWYFDGTTYVKQKYGK